MVYSFIMNRIFFPVVLSGIFFLLPSFSHAGPIIRTGEVVSVDSAQTIKGDFYGFGSKVVLSGISENDAYLAGGTITINAPVLEDLTMVGGVIQVYGEVGDDVRILGGEVTIAKPIKGDVVVMGNSLTILSTGSVEGDILFLGEDLVVDGPVVGTIHGNTNKARVNADIGGDVLLTVQTLFTIGGNANIHGLVSYESRYDVVRAQEASIAGEVHKTLSAPDLSYAESLKAYLVKLLVLVFATLTLFLLARRHVATLTQIIPERFGFYGLVGLASIPATLFISLVLFVSVLGSLVGAVLLLGFVSVLCIAIIFSPLAIGYTVQKLIFKSSQISIKTVGIGFGVLALLSIIPQFIAIILTVYTIVIAGAICTALYETLRAE